MSGKILEFKRSSPPVADEIENILNNLASLVVALEENAIYLRDEEGNEYDFKPTVGLTVLQDDSNYKLIQSNTQDTWVLIELLENVLQALRDSGEEEELDG